MRYQTDGNRQPTGVLLTMEEWERFVDTPQAKDILSADSEEQRQINLLKRLDHNAKAEDFIGFLSPGRADEMNEEIYRLRQADR